MLQILKARFPNAIGCLTLLVITISFLKEISTGIFTLHCEEPSGPMIESVTPLNLASECLIFTSHYCITVNLAGGELHVQLIDFSSFVVYGRAYTNSDIGAEINRRVGLNDIVNVLKYSKEVAKFEDGLHTTLKSNSGESLLAVGERGVLSVHVVVTTISGKQIAVSQLNLLKVRKMRDIEVFQVRLQIQKKQLVALYNQQYSVLEQQTKKLEARIKLLEQAYSQENEDAEEYSQNATKASRTLVENRKYKTDKVRKPSENKFFIRL